MNQLELERVLTKLKFDESVTGYALITNDGQPFLSFSLPDEVVPQIKGTLKIHASGLKLVNITTSHGSIILSRVDPQWVLAVLFTPELTLGTALSRAKSVVELLEQVVLPPPPVPVETDEVLISEPTGTEAPMESASAPAVQAVPSVVEETSAPPEAIELHHGCVVLRGERYRDAMTLDSALNATLKKVYSNLAVDILLTIDQKMTIYKIAGALTKPVERVLDVVKWCLAGKIVDVHCPEPEETRQKEIIEIPLFEGNLEKAKKEHRSVLALCDGTRSLQEIATQLGMQYFQVLQSILPYRGKTLKMVLTDKKSGV